MQQRIVEKALAIILALVTTTATADSIAISFDEFSEGTVVSNQLVGQGVILSSPSAAGAPSAVGCFPSIVSPPNYLVGENEGQIDLNPSSEFGNNRLALPITITFVDPANPAFPATTDFVSLSDVFVNRGSITRADAFALDGSLLLSQTNVGQGGDVTSLFSFSKEGIHRVTATFGTSGSTSFEDHAGIDNLVYSSVVPVPEPSLRMLLAAALVAASAYFFRHRAHRRQFLQSAA